MEWYCSWWLIVIRYCGWLQSAYWWLKDGALLVMAIRGYWLVSFRQVRNEPSSDVPPAIREVLDAFAKPAGQGLQPLLLTEVKKMIEDYKGQWGWDSPAGPIHRDWITTAKQPKREPFGTKQRPIRPAVQKRLCLKRVSAARFFCALLKVRNKSQRQSMNERWIKHFSGTINGGTPNNPPVMIIFSVKQPPIARGFHACAYKPIWGLSLLIPSIIVDFCCLLWWTTRAWPWSTIEHDQLKIWTNSYNH